MASQTNTRPPVPEPIAIVGSSCRFPGGVNSPSKLWQLLEDPVDLLSEIPSSRFNPKAFYHEDGEHHGSTNVTQSYLLNEDPTAFDNEFFQIHPREAEAMDPQQRLLLETVYEGIESAGFTISSLRGSDTSIFVGQMSDDYRDMLLRDIDSHPQYLGTGTSRAIMANRVSYFFDWTGPSVVIDTACSSSLVALHQAVQALRSGESEVAVAAGVNLLLGPEMYIFESSLHMLSPTGRSRMWDASADGYARGEGFACVVLKSLSRALADGDHIECIVRGTGVNQDGRSSGLTVPNASAQALLIKSTYARSGLDCGNPRDRCQFFEAHGTGTLAGDPKEAQGIRDAFFPRATISQPVDGNVSPSPRADKLYVGSIKTIIGHLEGTAGLAGVLKASLAVQKGLIPPNMHFNNLNPAIEPFYGNLEIPTKLEPWPELDPGTPRRVSVNSFGFGGTNAHVIIESWDERTCPQREVASNTHEVVPLSANSEESLSRALSQLHDYVKQVGSTNEFNLSSLAWTMQARRSVLPFRSTFTASSTTDLVSQLESAIATVSSPHPIVSKGSIRSKTAKPRILGIFTGQGAQWPAMGSALYKSAKMFRRTIDDLEKHLRALPGDTAPAWFLSQELMAPAESSRLNSAELSQPLCTAVQIALVDLLRQSGVTFSAVVGHSSGEIAAAYAAGFLSAKDAITVAYYRGYLVHRQEQPVQGKMLAVGMSFEGASKFCAGNHARLRGRICIAAVNSLSSVTLSGDADAIDDAKALLDDTKTFARVLKVDMAYHSHHMQPVAAPYIAALKGAGVEGKRTVAECNWYSSVHNGQLVHDAASSLDELDATYWAQNMVQPVLFYQAVRSCLATETTRGGFDVAIEVGPHAALKGPATDTINTILDGSLPYQGTLSRGVDDVKAFCDSLGFLWKTFRAPVVDFGGFHRACNPTWNPPIVTKGLPSYPWTHERSFIKESKRSKAWRTRDTPQHELLGTSTTVVSSGGGNEQILRWRNIIKLSEIPWMQGHRFQGQILFPAAGYLSMAINAVIHLAVGGTANGAQSGISLVELHDFQIHNAVTLDEDSLSPGVDMNLVARCLDRDENSVRVEYMCHCGNVDAAGTSGRSGSDYEKSVFTGQAIVILGESDIGDLPPRVPCQLPMKDVTADRFYQYMRGVGLQYSGDFTFDSLQRRSQFATVTKTSFDSGQYLIHPSTLDVALQSLYGAFSYPGDARLWTAYLPTRLERVRISMGGRTQQSSCGVSSSRAVVFADCHLREGSARVLRGDIDIFSSSGSDEPPRPLIQAQGVQFSAIEQPSAENDRKLYARNVWMADLSSGVDLPAVNRHTGSQADAQRMSLTQICDRTAYFYLRRLCEEVRDMEIPVMESHHQKFMRWAKEHILPMVAAGSNTRFKPEWKHDTYEDILALGRLREKQIDLRVLQELGPQLPQIMRGKASALQILLDTDGSASLLDEFYKTGLGYEQSNANLAAAVRQLSHRYPRLRILEVGAGTGGTSAAVLKALDGNCEVYDFTDLSPAFVDKARASFSSWSGLVRYRLLDISKHPSEQEAWVDDMGTYDLIIAANVLHATPFLSRTLQNCRSLMRPGGFMLLLEVTSPALRVPFIFGTLPGWWLGHADGRFHGPTVGEAEWHHLLQTSGFSGVDHSVRDFSGNEEFTYSVMASQATDSRIDLLRDPMSLLSSITSHGLSFKIDHLVVIGGDGLCTAKAASSISHLLRSKAKSVIIKRGIESVLPQDIPLHSAVICLSDVDRPVMAQLSRQRYEIVQAIFTRADYVLWTTRGRRSADPFASMIVGLGRVAAQENPRSRIRFVDVETGADLDVRLLASSLLESIILNNIKEIHTDDGAVDASNDVLWSDETEIVLTADGAVQIPRTKPDSTLNDRLNSRRRHINRLVSSAEIPLIVAQHESGVLTLDEAEQDSPLGTFGALTIKAEFSSLSAFCEPYGKPFYVCIGRLTSTNQRVLAITHSNSSIVQAQSDQIIPLDSSGEGSQILEDILTVILCQGLLCGVDETLWLHNASVRVSTVVRRLAAIQGAKVFNTTTNKEQPSPLSPSPPHEKRDGSAVTYVHPRITRHDLMQLVPAGVQRFVDMSRVDALEKGFKSLARSCLGPNADTQTFYGYHNYKSKHTRIVSNNTSNWNSARSSRTSSASPPRNGTRPSSPIAYSTSRLQDIIDTCSHLLDISDSMILSESASFSELSKLAVVNAEQLDLQQNQKIATENPLAIVNWTALHSSTARVPVKVKTLDPTKLFRSDRTYFLVGLAGEVGLSLCTYMIANGARHFAIASRNPQIDSAMLGHIRSTASSHLSSTAVDIRVFSLDVADRSALHAIHTEICTTMPPIAGVANGAMVLRDKSLVNMSYDDFTTVLRPKVDGSKNLDELFSNLVEGVPPLDFFILFSSLSCIVGNPGQANYAAANMYMTALVHNRRQRGLVGSVMDIGMVLGLGALNANSLAVSSVSVMEEHLRRHDFMAISEEDLHAIFTEAVFAGNPENGQNMDPEIVTGLGMQIEDVGWRRLARLSHFSLKSKVAGAESPYSSGSAAGKGSQPGASIHDQVLGARNEKEALEVLGSAFSTKLALMLGMDTSSKTAKTLDQGTPLIALGIDSLVAVDIRSWFAKELNVDVPMLKILSGAVVSEICTFALKGMNGLVFDVRDGETPVKMDEPLMNKGQVDVKELPGSITPQDTTYHSNEGLPAVHIEERRLIAQDQAALPVSIVDGSTMDHVLSRHQSPSASTISSPRMCPTPVGSQGFHTPVSVDSDIVTDFPANDILENEFDYERAGRMSFAQSQLFFLHEYLEDKCAYNIGYYGQIEGPLHVERLRQALHTVALRHESLRSAYRHDTTTERGVQYVLSEPHFILEHKAIPLESSEEELQNAISAIKIDAFDIAQGEVLKVVVLTMSPISHHIVFSHHHIALDGLSWTIFMDDLGRVYSGQPLQPVDSLQQSVDMANKKHIASTTPDQLATELAYWRSIYTNDIPEPVPLFPFALSKTRKPLTKYEHCSAKIKLPSTFTAAIRSVAAKLHVTTFHFYLATLAAFLSRSLNTNDFSIGIVDPDRPDEEDMSTIGYFLNMLPVRFDMRSTKQRQSDNDQNELPFKDLALGTRDSVLAAQAHARAPLDAVLDALAVPRSNSTHPLFQVVMNYRKGFHNFTNLSISGSAEETNLEWLGGVTAGNPYDLLVNVTETKDWTLLEFITQGYLYGSEDTELMLGWYERALEGLAEDPAVGIEHCPLAREEELVTTSGTTRCTEAGEMAWALEQGVDIAASSATLIHRIDAVAQASPDSVAIRDDSGLVLTFREMTARVHQIASYLARTLARQPPISGEEGQQRVAMLLEPAADTICSLLAILRLGLIWIPLDTRNHSRRLASIIKECRPIMLVCHNKTEDIAAQLSNEEGGKALLLNIDFSEDTNMEVPAPDFIKNRAQPSQPAVILYTSGSTGVPKGVVLRHNGLYNNIYGTATQFHVEHDIILQQSPIGFDLALEQIFLALTTRSTVVIVGKQGRGDPDHISQLIAQAGVTVTFFVPSEYAMLLNYGAHFLKQAKQWRIAFSGGEKLTDEVRASFRKLKEEQSKVRLVNVYGPAEISISCARGEVVHDNHRDNLFASLGYGMEIRDPRTMQILPVGFAGEICIRGIGVSMGYLGRDEETRLKFIDLPLSAKSNSAVNTTRVYRSGDLGRLLPNGSLDVLGRLDGNNQVKLRGIRIELDEIANVVVKASDGSIAQAAISLRQPGDVLIAFIVFEKAFHGSEADIVGALEKDLPLPTYMQPAFFVPIDAIPATANGKRDQAAIDKLPLPSDDGLQRSSSTAMHKTPTEEALEKVWRDVLPPARDNMLISPESDFFRFGGNSMILIKLRSLIQSTFGVQITLPEFFSVSTLRTMAARIDDNASSVSSIQPIDFRSEVLSLLGGSPKRCAGSSPSMEKSKGLVVLLTGATGYLGSHLLRHLITNPHISEVHCVAIRPGPDGTQRHLLPDVKSADRNKIKSYPGNLSHPALSLTPTQISHLTSTVDVIIHNGAEVSFLKSYHSLRNANVLATRFLAQMAIPRSIPLHFVSSARVANYVTDSTSLPLREVSVTRDNSEGGREYVPPPLAAADGYGAAKWTCEAMLERLAVDEAVKLPVYIHRISNIVGGNDSELDLLAVVFRYSLKMGVAPKLNVENTDGEFDMITVEECAEDMVGVALGSVHDKTGDYGAETAGDEGVLVKFIHHCNDDWVAPDQLTDFIKTKMARGPLEKRTLREAPYQEWLDMALKMGMHRVVYDFMSMAGAKGSKLKLPMIAHRQSS